MSKQIDERETLKAIALDLINKIYAAFEKAPLAGFRPGITTEDTDCVIQALEEATGLTLDWGEFDGDKHWLEIWGNIKDTQPVCDKIAAAWGTSIRTDGDMNDVEIPALLAEFACRVALEGEYPELVSRKIGIYAFVGDDGDPHKILRKGRG